jgi:hypothetical protein
MLADIVACKALSNGIVLLVIMWAANVQTKKPGYTPAIHIDI